MQQGDNPQKSSSSNVAIKPKATAGLRKFVTQDEGDTLARYLITGMPRKTNGNVPITNTTGLKEALCAQASLSFNRIKQLEYIHDHAFVEIIMYKKDVEKVEKAIKDFKQMTTKNPFNSCNFGTETSWHMYLNTKDRFLKKKEIKRLNEKIFQLSLALYTSKYSTFFNKVSDLWIESLKIINPKIDIMIYKAQVQQKVKDALKSNDMIDVDELDPGNVTDLEDMQEDFAAFHTAVQSTRKPSLKRKKDESNEDDPDASKSSKMSTSQQQDKKNKMELVNETAIDGSKVKSDYWSLTLFFIYFCFIFQAPIAHARLFNVHFQNQVYKIDLNNDGTLYNLLVSMLARGCGFGTFSEQSNSSYSQNLNTSLSSMPSDIWYTSSPETTQSTSQSTTKQMKFGGVNIRSAGNKFGILNRWLIEHDFDFLFASECNVNQLAWTPRNFLLFNPSNSRHGCGIMYNELKYNHGNLSVDGDEHHVILHLMSTSILFIYKPPTENCMSYHNRVMQKYMDRDLIILGDANVNTLVPLSTEQISFFDQLAIDGYLLFDITDDFTFQNHIGSSKIDHILYKETSTYRILDAGCIDTIQANVTDHKMLYLSVEFRDDPTFVMGKRSRWKYNNFKDEDRLGIFHHNLSLNEIKERNKLHEYLFNWEFGKDWKTQKKNCNAFFNLFIDIYSDAAKPRNSIGVTKHQQYVSTSHLAQASEQTLIGKSQIADDMLKEAKRIQINKNKSNRNKLQTTELLKVVKCSMQRKFTPNQSLNMFKCDDYIDDYKPKWKLTDFNDEYEPLFEFDDTCTANEETIISMSNLLKCISNLPHGKSPGEDLFINEFLQHSIPKLLQYLVDAFNLIIKTGITPTNFHKNLIIPVHKGKNQIFHLIIYYRPIALSSILKKLFEMCLKKFLHSHLHSGDNQYAYKQYYSTLDAIYHFQSIMNKLGKKAKNYRILKIDIDGAFDSLNHLSINQFINKSTMPLLIKKILSKLITLQHVAIQIGDKLSKFMTINQGIIQGSVLSPLIFISVVYDVMKDLKLPKNVYLIWYADDVLLIAPKNQTDKTLQLIKDQLATIGLSLNPNKTEEVTEIYTKYLGVMINKYGLDKNVQIRYNIKQAINKKRKLAFGGVFRGSLKEDHLTRVYGSYLLPILEYGLALFQPTKSGAIKIDSFIASSLKQLCSIPFYVPTEDVLYMYNITSYHQRWYTIVSKYHNSRSIRENKLDWLEYTPPSRMSFKLIKPLANILYDNPFMKRVLKRCYPKPNNIICPSCQQQHNHVNEYYKCCTKHLPIIYNTCTKNCLPVDNNIPDMFLGRINSVQDSLDSNTIAVISDASLHPNTMLSSGGMVFITKDAFWVRTVSLSNILPSSSCRAEIATICSAVLDLDHPNIVVYCDAQSAIDSINHFKEKTKRAEKIHSIDLLRQIRNTVPKMELKKIKGHDTEDPHNLNHLADTLSHDHHADQCPLELLTILPDQLQTQPQYADGFRIRKLVEALKNNDIYISYFAALRDLDRILMSHNT